MGRKTLDLEQIASPDQLATELATKFVTWKQQRKAWEDSKIELRQYVFQTDTTKTRNAKLPWQNTTTRPKLCQIRDNLHSNYFSALSLEGAFLKWEGYTRDDAARTKADSATAYVKTKFEDSGGPNVVSQLLYDYIDYGIAIAGIEYVNWYNTNEEGETTNVYTGPRLIRYNPIDVVWDLTATDFDVAPKITRSVLSLGELHRLARDYPEYGYDAAALEKMSNTRRNVQAHATADISRINAFQLEGLGDIHTYFTGGMVELLTFEGDYFDVTDNTLYENAVIVVADRCHIISHRVNPSWIGKSNKRAVGWRPRPDSLMPMGPLDNLVGMQYRLDHLQNMKADAMDQIVYPRKKIKGFVQDFSDEPGEDIYCGDDGDVTYLQPDLSFLQVENEIQILENSMEEFAGAPKTALGIRTPGEKTAYEVQQLENAAGRIFQIKINQFERQLFEPILNLMLESGRRNLDGTTVVRNVDDQLGGMIYTDITKEDIIGQGAIHPVGARHFAERAKLVQELTNFLNSSVGQDQGVRVHFSGKQIAKLMNDALNFGQYNLYGDNVQVDESAETQLHAAQAQQNNQLADGTDSQLGGEGIALTDQLAQEQMANEVSEAPVQ